MSWSLYYPETEKPANLLLLLLHLSKSNILLHDIYLFMFRCVLILNVGVTKIGNTKKNYMYRKCNFLEISIYFSAKRFFKVIFSVVRACFRSTQIKIQKHVS